VWASSSSRTKPFSIFSIYLTSFQNGASLGTNHPPNERSLRFVSTKPIELRFKALLTEGDARVRFYREGFDGFATPSP